MRGQYAYSVKYIIDATCVSPFRTGGADGTVEDILVDYNGNPFVQGTSIAGALREWIRSSEFSNLENDMFEYGNVIISEGIFASEDGQRIKTAARPRLKIDGRTGTAQNGGKYTICHVPSGSRFTFSITILEKSQDSGIEHATEMMLSALNEGYIRFGAQRSNGYGIMSLDVRKAVYDLTIREDMDRWIEGTDIAEKIELPTAHEKGRIVFSFSASVPGMLVKSETAEKRNGKMVAVNIKEHDIPVIPASSVKGAVRNRVKAIADIIRNGDGDGTADYIFGHTGDKDNGEPGKVYFTDAHIENSKSVTCYRIKINRFTGGVFNRGLFGEEPESGEIRFSVIVPEDDMICGFVFLALRDLGAGLYGLGSGSNIGRGYMKNASLKAELPSGSELSLAFDQSGNAMLNDPENTAQKWITAAGGAGK